MSIVVIIIGILLALLVLKLVFGMIKFVLVGIIVLAIIGWVARKAR